MWWRDRVRLERLRPSNLRGNDAQRFRLESGGGRKNNQMPPVVASIPSGRAKVCVVPADREVDTAWDGFESLTSRNPTLTGTEIVDHLVPPRQFRSATFDSYRPDPDYPSQQGAVDAVRAFAGAWGPSATRLFGRRRHKDVLPGIYFDGGFGVGIHNTLEAAVWNLPVVFGPNYQRFKEARELISRGGGFTIDTYEALELALDQLLENNASGKIAGEYVSQSAGSTAIIINQLKRNTERNKL